jgi:hypothetical protein
MNALSSICDNIDADSNPIDKSELHSTKHSRRKASTHEGRRNSTNPLSPNGFSSICDDLESDSSVTEESDHHERKEHSPKISTDTRRMILNKPVSKNTWFSIRDNLDADSKVTEQSDLQWQKHSITQDFNPGKNNEIEQLSSAECIFFSSR